MDRYTTFLSNLVFVIQPHLDIFLLQNCLLPVNENKILESISKTYPV